MQGDRSCHNFSASKNERCFRNADQQQNHGAIYRWRKRENSRRLQGIGTSHYSSRPIPSPPSSYPPSLSAIFSLSLHSKSSRLTGRLFYSHYSSPRRGLTAKRLVSVYCRSEREREQGEWRELDEKVGGIKQKGLRFEQFERKRELETANSLLAERKLRGWGEKKNEGWEKNCDEKRQLAWVMRTHFRS